MNDWSYYLFNCTYIYSNILLSEIYEEFLNIEIDNYYFVRFTDYSFPSIRLRVKTTKEKNEKFKSFIGKLEDNGNIWNLSLKKYNREFNRYSITNFQLIESIFHIDSKVIFQIFKEYNYLDETSEILLGIKFIHDFYDILNIDLNNRISIIELQINGLANELKISNTTKRNIYNYKRNNIFNTDFLFDENQVLLNPNFLPFIKYSNLRKDLLSKLPLSRLNNKVNSIQLINHMSVNKIYQKSQKLYEYMIYNLLIIEYKKQAFINLNKSKK